MPIPHIIFDLDGTLIDSSASILASFEQAFRSQGIVPKRALTPEVIGPPLMQTLATLCGSQDAQLLQLLADAFKAHYDTEGYKQTEVFPGVVPMLQRVAASGSHLYIATNKRLNPTLKIMQHLGWDAYFTRVFALDYYAPPLSSKQQMLTRILADESIPPSAALYIGDRYEDGVAADNNAIEFALVSWGYLDETIGTVPAHWRQYATPESMAASLG